MQITPASRKLYDALASGWNTWDVYSVTAHVHMPSRVRVGIAFSAPHRSAYVPDVLWDNVDAFGEHADDGSYTDVSVSFFGGRYRVETAARTDEIVIRVTPLTRRHGALVHAEISPIWGSRVDCKNTGEGIVASSSGVRFALRAHGPQPEGVFNPSRAPNVRGSLDGPVYFGVNSAKRPSDIDTAIDAARSEWLERAPSADGDLGDGLMAMRRSLLWNMIYEPLHDRVVTPVSRNWCKERDGGFGQYVLFGWDTFFAALQYGLLGRDLAYATFFSILEEITPEGMIPNFGSANGQSRDRTEPNVGALCAWKLYQQFGDVWFLEECFDRLLAWNRWMLRERDRNHDGLLEHASTPWEAGPDEEVWGSTGAGGKPEWLGTKQAAMFESGLDNSTMWDRAVFNEEKHCLELSYVGLNALVVADCRLLAKIARVLSRTDEAAELAQRADALARRINEELWDERTQCYLNKHWSGELDPCLSLTHLYPLLAGVADATRTRALVDRHLLNPAEFWGKYVIPNIARSDPSFADQDYWRGRIWAPTNFLVGEGLACAGETAALDELASKGLDLFVRCWRERGLVGENYNAITGEAAEKGKHSDRFYHWGALLAYMALERRIRFDPWGDTVLVARGAGAVRNVPVHGGRIDILPDAIVRDGRTIEMHGNEQTLADLMR